MLTGRDAAYKKMIDLLNKGEKLPVDLASRLFITSARLILGMNVGPAGPTTATRMDKLPVKFLSKPA